MKIEFIKSFFKFSNEQRKGIFILLSVIIVLQMLYYFTNFRSVSKTSLEKIKWLSLQSKVDSLKQAKAEYVSIIYPFNPNFITDYKGYKLGMSAVEIDRLLLYRKQNKYVNSATEFQTVTQVSDSLLSIIAPYFKFPDWVSKQNNEKKYVVKSTPNFIKKDKVIIDINYATQEDLIKIYGIGEAISQRILSFKESIGGFVSMDQMNDIYGLSPEVLVSLQTNFKVSASFEVKKININNASMKELSAFPYFRYPISKNILIYRSMNGDLKNYEDLTKIKGLSIEKAKIIGLYLEF